jgi:hypothetical protein
MLTSGPEALTTALSRGLGAVRIEIVRSLATIPSLVLGALVVACGSSPPPSREAKRPGCTTPGAQISPPHGGDWHQEISVGQTTILATSSSLISFFARSDGTLIDAGLGTGTVVDATRLFDSFFHVASPNFINENLPVALWPSSGLPPYETCDASKDAPVDGAPLQSSSCMTQNIYDTHSTYDQVHQRFIIAAHVRNMNWTFPTNPTDQYGKRYTNPGPPIDPWCWRYILFAVSVSEDPTQGFWLYRTPEFYGDWPRVGVSGNYFVVSNHGAGSTYEYDNDKPLIMLYVMDDLARGIGNVGFVAPPSVMPPAVPAGELRSFGYRQAQLLPSLPYSRDDFANGAPGFLVVPTHDDPPDPSGPLAGTAYVMSRSAHGEVPTLFGFVAGSDGSVAPTVISASMPSTYAGQDPTSATIRGGALFSAYDGHIDKQLISTTHSASSASVSLSPVWGADVAPGSGLSMAAPLIEATADGSAVLGYSVIDAGAGTLDLRSMTFFSNGAIGNDVIWATGPYSGVEGSVGDRNVNRISVDPRDPQAVWILGMVGASGSDMPVAQEVFVSKNACAQGSSR